MGTKKRTTAEIVYSFRQIFVLSRLQGQHSSFRVGKRD